MVLVCILYICTGKKHFVPLRVPLRINYVPVQDRDLGTVLEMEHPASCSGWRTSNLCVGTPSKNVPVEEHVYFGNDLDFSVAVTVDGTDVMLQEHGSITGTMKIMSFLCGNVKKKKLVKAHA